MTWRINKAQRTKNGRKHRVPGMICLTESVADEIDMNENAADLRNK